MARGLKYTLECICNGRKAVTSRRTPNLLLDFSWPNFERMFSFVIYVLLWLLIPRQAVESEFLIILRDQADLSPAYTLTSKAQRGQFTRDALLNTAELTQRDLTAWLESHNVPHRSFYIVNAIWVKTQKEIADEIAIRADVLRVEPNPQVRMQLPRLPLQALQDLTSVPQLTAGIEPGLNAIHAPEVWALGYRGEGITIASADTGVQWDHPALKSKYRGWNGSSANHNFNWHDSIHTGGGTCGANSTAPCDPHSHGTHTAGTAVGDDGAGNQIGVAPEAKLIACRNMNEEGAGSPASYIECMEFFLAPYPIGGTRAQGDPTRAPDITINSWGCPPTEGCGEGTLKAAVEAQRAAGIMMVVAAGNAGPFCATAGEPPGHYDASYTVGALDQAGNIAAFSSRGPSTIDQSGRIKPDISAPGVNVRSSVPGGGYLSFQGTSMAAPHVAGAVALLWSARNALRHKIDSTEDILNHSAASVSANVCSTNGVPNNAYGWGRLNIKAAVDLALSSLGRVTANGQSLAGVTIYFSRVSGNGSIPPPVLTDATGKWSQTGFDEDTRYVAYARLGNYTFVPRVREFAGPATGLDFQTSARSTRR